MNTPEKCPKCGAVNLRFIDRNTSQFNCGSVSRNGTVVVQTFLCTTNQRDQLTTKLTAIESTHAECAEKMKRFRSRWLSAHQELRRTEDMVERAEERVRQLEASLRECTEWIYWESTNDSREATDVECYQRAVNLLKP